MLITLENALALEALEAKLRILLPEQYRDSYDDVAPMSMGSAGLKFGSDGQVAWDAMWATYCDLAMAGGPPHRGTLLEPPPAEDVIANPQKFHRAADEICRGISLVTGLRAQLELPEHGTFGICVECRNAGMAGWLVRAIVMENVLARHEAEMLYLPAGPEFRIAKEIKNVITAIAKTCHYWTGHMPAEQQKSIQAMIAGATRETELLEPASLRDIQDNPTAYRNAVDAICRDIAKRTEAVCFPHRYVGWIGVECPNVHSAIWLMRAMVAANVLARREETTLFLPVHPRFAADGRLARIAETFAQAHSLYGCLR
jgi:hypothetical protein